MAAAGGTTAFKLPHRAAERVLADLAPLLAGGVPMDRALKIVAAQQRKGRGQRAVASLSAALAEGRPLSTSMAADEAFFGTATVAAVRAGESSGTLAESLTRYVQHLKKEAEMRRKLGSAMAYPLTVAFVAVVVFFLLFLLVVPRIASLLEALGGVEKAPWPTRFVMSLSDAVREPWLYVALVVFGGVLAFLFLPREGGNYFRRCARRLPFVGGVVEESVAARMAAALSSLLKAGVPLPEALRLAGPAGGDNVFSARMWEAAAEVERGIPVSSVFRKIDWKGAAMLAEVAALGEETGTLAEELEWAAAELESRSSSRGAVMLSLVEPALVVMMALLVGLVAAALFLPVLSLADRIGG